MSIRTKALINLVLFVLAALALTAQELRTFHPNLLGL